MPPDPVGDADAGLEDGADDLEWDYALADASDTATYDQQQPGDDAFAIAVLHCMHV